jgi:hypothetical protein
MFHILAFGFLPFLVHTRSAIAPPVVQAHEITIVAASPRSVPAKHLICSYPRPLAAGPTMGTQEARSLDRETESLHVETFAFGEARLATSQTVKVCLWR